MQKRKQDEVETEEGGRSYRAASRGELTVGPRGIVAVHCPGEAKKGNLPGGARTNAQQIQSATSFGRSAQFNKENR